MNNSTAHTNGLNEKRFMYCRKTGVIAAIATLAYFAFNRPSNPYHNLQAVRQYDEARSGLIRRSSERRKHSADQRAHTYQTTLGRGPIAVLDESLEMGRLEVEGLKNHPDVQDCERWERQHAWDGKKETGISLLVGGAAGLVIGSICYAANSRRYRTK